MHVETPDVTAVDDQVRAELRRSGAMSFARFMELCLYSPKIGYYETHSRTIGRTGDYFTNVSVGEVFGQLLAAQIAEWFLDIPPRAIPEQAPPTLVEAGAHDGRLALDILTALRERAPDLYARLRYVVVEPSDGRQRWQRETLAPHADRLIQVSTLGELAPFHGVFVCNELLDAFPVHRFGWNRARRLWEEIGVMEAVGGLAWSRLERPSFSFEEEAARAGFSFPAALLEVLPDGYIVELNPKAAEWWAGMGGRLASGVMVAVDYGLPASEWIQPGRSEGTTRAYSEHRVSDDLLAMPGRQDLTAHVNFTAIERTGLAVGLTTAGLSRQSEFLTRIVQRAEQGGRGFGWGAAQLRQFQTLVHPAHLGHSFRVLVQKRDIA